ncbi:MAG: hypothetical protein E7464_02290 [Ruminococcaceae bacterium]|nr:hypothetical protein [Oscillospiraceae bacterium]
MADQIFSFRTALNGFHRGDVIAFLEELTKKHSIEMDEQQEALRHATEEVERLRGELRKLQEERPSEIVAPAEEAPAFEASPDAQGRELEAYRRAERCEREARLRAGRIYGDVSAAVESAGAQLIAQEEQLTKISATVSSDIIALQAAMADVRIQLNATRRQISEMERSLQPEEA